MKKKLAKKALVFEEKRADFNKAHKALLEFYELLRREREKQEKDMLLKQLREVTQDKDIVLGNYLNI